MVEVKLLMIRQRAFQESSCIFADLQNKTGGLLLRFNTSLTGDKGQLFFIEEIFARQVFLCIWLYRRAFHHIAQGRDTAQ